MPSRAPSSNTDILLYFLALFVPPATVGIKRGCGADLIINILLCFLGWLPGVIHAWWLVSKYPDSDYHQTQGQAYHVVQPAQQPYPPARPVHQQPYPGQQPGYAAPNKY